MKKFQTLVFADGTVRKTEMGNVHGNCTRVLFMPEVPEGSVTSFVSVPNAEFTFRSRV